jgi:hydrogenase large subunit
MAKKTINVPLNRVEGDLEVKVQLDGGRVVDAWCSGTMFRGFENMMKGRGMLDGLVITPRICGICSTTHLMSAARALDNLFGVDVPDHAHRVRNIALMAEHLQSDIRHAFLIFAVDFLNPAHKKHSLHAEAVKRYKPIVGDTAAETLRESKKMLEIVAILGGQWPHSSFMVPGGVVGEPGASEILDCRHLLAGYRKWYEGRVLGCTVERWQQVDSAKALDKWLKESDSHRDSELGFFIRFMREAGFESIGGGHNNYISYGSLELPKDTDVAGKDGFLVPSGYAEGLKLSGFTHTKVSEHVTHSWFEDYPGGRHPFDGETKPYATGHEGKKYSWAKSPRYDGKPAETGPLAERVISGDPLIKDLVGKSGPNVFVRQLARMTRPTTLIGAMDTWLGELLMKKSEYYVTPREVESGEGFGLTQAGRGALGHWLKVEDGKISHYQVITPTAWHASPRDSEGVRGPFEEALVGTPVLDPDNPVELGHVIRSFDACLVCTVHAIEGGKEFGSSILGI